MSVDPLIQPWTRLQRAIIGYRLSFALGVAAKLGIADLLRDGPRHVDELARGSGSNVDALRRVLCLLASEGFFEERDADIFALTPDAELLRSDSVGSMRVRATIEAEEWARAWADLGYSVATGLPSFERQFGMPLFDYYQRDPDAAARFDATMTSMTAHVTPALVEGMELPEHGTIVDIGGGAGTLLRAMLMARPHVHGVLFDLPHVVERARPVLADVLDRCDLVGGDFFTAVPSGGDVYVLKFIMDDWGPDDSLRILRNCRQAMAPGGRVLINEMVLRPGNTPFYGRWTDVNMLVLLGGRERTEAEYRALLDAAGLRLQRIRPTASDFSIVEAVASGS